MPDDQPVSSVHSQWGKPRGPPASSSTAPSPTTWPGSSAAATGPVSTGRRRSGTWLSCAAGTRPRCRSRGLVFAGAFPLDGFIGGSSFGFQFRLPFERTEYYLADDTRWQTEFQTIEPDTGVFEPPTSSRCSSCDEGVTAPRSGVARSTGPAFPDVEGSPSQWVYRHHGGGSSESSIGTAQDSDAIAVSVPVYDDLSDDHEGFSREDTGRTSLYLDGELIGETDRAGLGDFGVPDADAEYRLVVSGARPSYAEVSTEVSATWTFRSAHVSEAEFSPLPVMAVRFGPDLDENNTARAGRPLLLPVWVQRRRWPRRPGQRSPARRVLRRRSHLATVPSRVGGGGLALRAASVERPFVSLRAGATDSVGNSVQQTILRAYRLRH